MQSDNTFGKEEKLCRNKPVEVLFTKGKSFVAYPLRVVYILDDEELIQNRFASVLISVSKRKFKRAVKRNRVKRLVREAYRLNKSMYNSVLADSGKSLNIAFIYLKNELPDYPEIEKAIQKAAEILSIRIKEMKDEKTIH